MQPAVSHPTDVDDDAAGVTITTTTGTSPVTEGGTVTYDVRLNTKPTTEVHVHLESKNTARATLSPSDLASVPAHWDAPQQVTVNAAVITSMTAMSTSRSRLRRSRARTLDISVSIPMT